MNDPPEYEIVVFNAALELPAAERAAYLDRKCKGNLDLYRRVEALLQVHEQAGTFLDAPAVRVPLSVQTDSHNPNTRLSRSVTDALKYGDRIGRYKILEQIGEGGCGAVYLAEQEEPVRRRVALKLIKLGMDTKTVLARFEAEQQALAMMDHPNIAKVFDAGATDTGRPFFVMELVSGGARVTDHCDRHGLSTHERLDLFILVCRAVQHAHQKGIIHRDLKPSNILVAVNDGVPMPKVIDFGIAKATQGRLTEQTVFTALEQFVGTPAYMSPEQSVLTSVDIDTRSDIYSLGVLLYELLIGETPFQGKELLALGMEAMRRVILEKEPVRPSTRLSAMVQSDLKTVARNRRCEPPKLIHLVRGDLDWIVMKCLEKDRARRYDTVNGLVMDLQRFLLNQPVVARPPSNWYRLRKLIRRHQLVFTAAAAVVAALIAGLSLSVWQFAEKSKAEAEQARLRAAAQKAQAGEAQLRRRAEAQELAARKKAYASDMNLLQQALAVDDLVRAQELLDRQRPQPGQQDLRGWEWRYFWQFCQSDVSSTFCRRSNSITSVSFSSDGRKLAVNTFAGEVTLWDVASRRMIFRHAPLRERPSRLAFAPAGELVAFYDDLNNQHWVVLWDCRTQAEVRRLELGGVLRDLAFSRDGRLFTADLGSSNNITVWDLTNGTALAHFTARLADYDMGTVFNIANSGGRVAQVLRRAPNSVQVVDLNGGTDSSFRVTEELTTALAFSPDERILVTAGGYAEGAVRLWEIATRQLIGSLEGHRSWVSCVRFLPDGRTVISASADGTIRLWDFVRRQSLRTLRGISGELWTMDVSPDGGWVVSGCKDGSVSLWNLTAPTNRPPAFRTLPTAGPGLWEFSPDGKMLGAIEQNQLRLYDTATLERVAGSDLTLTNVASFGFSPDMRLVVTADRSGNLSVWNRSEDRMVTNFAAHSGGIALSSASFMRGGQRLLTHGVDGMAKEWDVSTWKETRRWAVDSNEKNSNRSLAISPSANLVATASADGLFELIPALDPERRRYFTGESRTVAVALSRNGRTLAAASENGTVELWDTETTKRAALMHGVMLGYHSVAISPDGKRVAAGSNGQEAMKIWDVDSHEEVATLRGSGSFFSHAGFSPDGNTIGACNWNSTIHLWSAPSRNEVETAEKTRGKW